MDRAEVGSRFAYHRPPNEEVVQQMEDVRALCLSLAHELLDRLDGQRETAIAITNLEQVMFWSIASIARANSVAGSEE